jgi:hypothetical protein
MASGTTARRKLLFPKSTDAPKVTTDIEGLANQLDNDVEIKTGTLAARPGPSLFGKMYYVTGDATVANNGILWLDLGASWTVANSTAAGQVYSAEASRAINTLFEPSATRATQVVVNTGGSAGGNIVVGGVIVGILKEKVSFPFICPAGLSWKYEAAAGATCASSYCFL